jgi:mono/diheme cytochrome c family protein
MKTRRPMQSVIIMLCFFSLLPLPARGTDPKTNWMDNCVQCHGPDGSANTMMGKAVNAKDLTNAQVQASFTDTQIATVIKDGAKQKSATMPAFGGKLTDDEIKALVAYVRKLKQQ